MFKNLIRFTALGLLLSVAAGVANAGIIAYWPFDEGTGDTAKDVVGGANAKLTGINWVTGRAGGFAAESPRGSASILVGTGPTPKTKDLSLAFWMVDTYDSYHTLMNKGVDSSQAGHYILLRPTTEDSPLRFRIGGFQAYGGWGTECRAPAGAYRDNEWAHVVCTYDSASDTATIYINGKLAPNGVYNPKTGIAGPTGYCQGTNDPTQPLYLVGQRETFGGKVDEVAIWDNALTAENVDKVYAFGPLALDPRMASSPKPTDGATDVVREAVLEWRPGQDAASHDVYLGKAFVDVNTAGAGSPLLVSKGQTAPMYDPPGRLDFGTTYYWRIDETSTSVMKGSTWKFTTEPMGYAVDRAAITATASSNEPNQGPVNTTNSSGLAADLHSEDLKAMWLTAQDATGPAWIRYDFDRLLRLNEMWVWNHNGLLESMLGLSAKEVKIEYSTDGTDFKVLGTTFELARAPGRAGYACNNVINLQNIAAKSVKLTILSNWGGILPQCGLSEVRFFNVPVFAREPNPVPGTAGVSVDVTLGWRAGREAGQHKVYLSTDKQAVTDSTASATTMSETQYGAALDLDRTYYWKVEEVNAAQTPSSWSSPVWSFATEPYVAVENFERYTDKAGEEIWSTWIDGYADDFKSSGSTVGSINSKNGTFGETTIVHSGRQSMPLAYDNLSKATYSEATQAFDAPQDWSNHGIKALTLRFYGDPANVAQQMYVKINSTKVLYDGAPESLLRKQWQMWYIDLSALKVSKVTSLSIGFDRLGAVGGKGTVFFDDLRLYGYDRVLITPGAPSATGLQLQYQFEGNLNDDSGKGRKGSVKGAPQYLAGKVGQAISLDGGDDSVNVDGYKGILADAAGVQQAFTVCAWIKTATNGRDIIAWGTNVGGQRMNFRVDTVLRVEHGGGNMRGTNGPSLLDNEWHHVAATVPQGGTLPDTRLYVDGGDVSAPASATAAYNLKANVDVAIGMGGSIATGRFFLGLIDDARIYDRVLSPGEIASLAGRTVPFDKGF
ncbi:MAG: hypothetical protein MUC88_23785 [Planctomycetes bacterium]|nr:hypothetical protein [Planctomycetota bacterium]